MLYTTGEVAKLCGVSVRTVQYYDTRNILIPSELSEGGRRLYSEEDVKRLEDEGKIVELRAYDTVYGIWKYFTVNDGNLSLDKENYLMIGTLEAYVKIRDYFGKDVTVPIYVEIDDGERLARALKRERQPENQKYEEMCRRFLADAADFSEDKIKEAGIERRFQNDDLENTLLEIKEYIESLM